MTTEPESLNLDELEMRDREALAAIGEIQSYLHDYFISDDCHHYMLMSCMSCQALAIKTQLTMLANTIAEDCDLPLIPKEPEASAPTHQRSSK